MTLRSQSKTWIAIPSYWTHPASVPGPEDTYYDHPTPLDSNGTLPALMNSLTDLNGTFNVLIVAAATHPSLGRPLHHHITQLLKPYAAKLPVYLISPVNLSALNAALPTSLLKLDTYGNIRNTQLLFPFIAGADVVAGIDDDEVIEDRDYIPLLLRSLKACPGNGNVGGIAGPYYDANGEYRIQGAESLKSHPNLFVKKNYFMNEALKSNMSRKNGAPFKSCVAFGGNMAMTRNAIVSVCHDPYIARGEDFDYVINAAMQGFDFFYEPKLGITHLPPDSTGSQAADKCDKLIADIRRFIYMQTKMNHFMKVNRDSEFSIDRFHPYPGPFLDAKIDLRQQGIEAIEGVYPEIAAKLNPRALVAEAAEKAEKKTPEYFEYRTVWEKTLTGMAQGRVEQGFIDSFRVN